VRAAYFFFGAYSSCLQLLNSLYLFFDLYPYNSLNTLEQSEIDTQPFSDILMVQAIIFHLPLIKQSSHLFKIV